MSTIEANNIKKGANSLDIDYVLEGSVKAWAQVDGTGTVGLVDSLNTSSVTDLGTGRYQPNWTNNFSSGDISAVASTESAYSSTSGHATKITARHASSVSLSQMYFGGGSSGASDKHVHVHVLGDLS